MNAQEFYDDFKAALNYLGLRWGEMHLATVHTFGGTVVFTYGGRTAAVTLPAVIE